jgi:hypothetical protein
VLTELSRVHVLSLPGIAPGPQGTFAPRLPACAQVGDSLWFGEVGCIQPEQGDPWICAGVDLYSSLGHIPIDLGDQSPPYRAAMGMWLFDQDGELIVALLTTIGNWPGPMHLTLLHVDPGTGGLVSTQDIDTGVFGDPTVQTTWPGFVERGSGGGLLLRQYTYGQQAGDFQARYNGSSWSFTSVPPEDWPYPPVDVDGVSLGIVGDYAGDAILSDHETAVPVPHPAGYGQSWGLVPAAAMYRPDGGAATLVLSAGVNPSDDFLLLDLGYDLCLYGSTANTWWEGELPDDGYGVSWGSGTLVPGITPSLPGDGTVVLSNPADPGNPWAWATLPPGAGQNNWMAFYVDGDLVQVHYGGRVVLVWRMPPKVHQQFVDGGAFMGFYNSFTKQWQAEAPPGWPPAQPPPLNGWAYLVDSRHWVGESGGNVLSHGIRIDADDVLVFPGDRAVVGQALQDDVIQSAPIKYIAGRDLPEVVLSRDDALLVWDAGYGQYLYPVEEPA